MRYCIGSMCAMPLTTSIAQIRRALAALAASCVAVCAVSCGEASSPTVPPAGAREARIASLSPALTECAVELGLAARIVGGTPWCIVEGSDVPVVGTLLDVDAETLVRCAPSLLLVQPPAQGIDPALEDLAARHRWTMLSWRINGLDDARDAMDGIAAAVAEADPPLAEGMRERQAAWVALLDAALVPLPPGSGTEHVGPVLVMLGGLEGIAFGRGTYIDDALGHMGVRNVLERTGYPALSVEDVARLSPRTIIVIGAREGKALSRPETLSATVIQLPSDGLAVPGGRLPHGLMALREALSRAGGGSGG